MMSSVSRRGFLAGSLGAAGLWAGGSLGGLQGTSVSFALEAADKQPEIAVFTKSFQAWSLPEVCRKFRELGVTGLDLTVRPGGHIEPGDIARKLPEADRIVRDEGLKIVQITSNVTTTDEYGRTLFETAGELGLRKIKLGYYRSKEVGQLQQQIKLVQQDLRKLVELGAANNVLPCVHIHSGLYLPSHGTLLYLMLRDFEPGQIGAYVDSLHMSLEGGAGGWQQGLDLLAPWISLCAIKNYLLTTKPRDQAGQQRWGWKTAPLADGVSPLPDFVKTLKKLDYHGPFSLHSEYLPELNIEECYAQTARDLEYFRTLL